MFVLAQGNLSASDDAHQLGVFDALCTAVAAHMLEFSTEDIINSLWVMAKIDVHRMWQSRLSYDSRVCPVANGQHLGRRQPWVVGSPGSSAADGSSAALGRRQPWVVPQCSPGSSACS